MPVTTVTGFTNAPYERTLRLSYFCYFYLLCSMFLDRYYRRRRWIVGSVMVSIAVITMLLAPPPSVVSATNHLCQDSSLVLCRHRL